MNIHGIFAIYKPVGPTSHDIVNQLRKITGERRIGHAGTLDPLASGVLVVAIGREFTKKLSEIVKKEKEYLAKIKFGEYSTTDDQEGEKTKVDFLIKPTLKIIQSTIVQFIGKIEQIPPQYSAIKIKGKTAYSLARIGEKIELKSRLIEIKNIEIIKYSWPYLELKVVCGSGVYIRSLARDLGEKLNVGGYLYSLERTRVGQFTKKESSTIKKFEKNSKVLKL